MDEIKKRKLALRKYARKVFKDIIMKNVILDIEIKNEIIKLGDYFGTPIKMRHTGLRTVTFRIFQKQ